jgi:hypothetical protein
MMVVTVLGSNCVDVEVHLSAKMTQLPPPML